MINESETIHNIVTVRDSSREQSYTGYVTIACVLGVFFYWKKIYCQLLCTLYLCSR